MRFICALICLSLLPTLPLSAEQPAIERITRPTVLIQSSGYVFAGTVNSITPFTAREKNAVPTIRIAFHVDHAVQGVHSGQVLTIQEWAGLWEAGQRYRPGEKVLLFLYPPSKLGLTSAVQGPLGRFPIDKSGQVTIDPGHRSGLSARVWSRISGRSRIDVREFTRILRLDLEGQP